MAYPGELLQLAETMMDADWGQACLRRFDSTAHYALFHLLIAEAVRNWPQPEFRAELGRVFEHRKMKQASVNKSGAIKNAPLTPVSRDLLIVVDAFVQLQEGRHEADYNTEKTWDYLDVFNLYSIASRAFESWRRIREAPEAEACLFSLFGFVSRK